MSATVNTTPGWRYRATSSAGGPAGKPYAVWDTVERKAVSHHRTVQKAMRAAQARNRAR